MSRVRHMTFAAAILLIVSLLIATAWWVSAKDVEAGFFEPSLPLGCTVDATERAWVEVAKRKLPKEAMPRILNVYHANTAHSFCIYITPRGTWYAYNPSKGSEEVLDGEADAMAWAIQCDALATGATLEE